MKAIYGWLHTHQWKERIYSTTPICPLCGATDTNDHILTCQSTIDERGEVVNKFIASISAGTPTEVQALIHDKLCDALAIPTDDRLMNALTTAYDEASTHQDALGWINFIRGRHSLKFQEAYDGYLAELPIKQRKKSKYKTGQTWATSIVAASLTLLVEIWYARNEKYRSPEDIDATMTPSLREIHERVREAYSQRMDYSEDIRAKLFEVPIDQRLQQRPLQLVKWIQTVDTAEKGPRGRQVAPVYSYFHPTRPPAVPQ